MTPTQRKAMEQALDGLIESARLLGATQAKKGFGCYSREDAVLERAWHESIAKHSTALRAALAEQPAEQEPVATVQQKVPEGVEAHLHHFLPVGTKLYTAPQPAKQPLTEDEAKAIAYVGPVYAPDGVVTRYPLEYRKELEQHRLDAIRRTEAAHGIEGQK